jgi:hypothetical protein
MRIVIKVGTSTIVRQNGSIDMHSLDLLARTLSDIKGLGHEVILVVFVRVPLIFPGSVPEPLAAIPVTVAVLSLVQLKLTPLPVIATGVIAEAEQIV